MALGTKIGEAFFDVSASFIGLGESLESGIVNAFSAKAGLIGTALERLGKELTKKFTLPLAIATAANIAQFAVLNRAVSETLTLFGTAPSLLDETFTKMHAGITDVSEAVGGLEREIADGLYQTISAGIPRGDAFEFLEVAQMVAVADKTSDLTTAVDGLTTGLASFNLGADQASRVSDVLFAGVAKGKTTFGELANVIGRVFPLAAAAGGTLEETTAIIAQLTVQGLKTSEAVSFLRAAITGLIRPGEEMNEIFQRLGFSSAETAIPVLGLQGAFQAVVDAAGGSTSKLQELIGTSEGVLAILGVTGDNAEKFAGTLDFITNSAGITNQAFEIVDATISRSFGRMTEAFDSLGTLFGGMASQFAQPVVDTITKIVVAVRHIFENLIPVAKNLGEVFAKLFKVFDLPLVTGMVAGFIALFLVFTGLFGLMGPMLILVGSLLVKLAQAKAATVLWRILGDGFKFLVKQIQLAGAAMVKWAGIQKAASASTLKFAGSVKILGIAMQTTLGKFALAIVAIAALAVAVGAMFIIWSKYKDAQKAAFEATQTHSIGVDRLAESLGIAQKKVSLFNDAMGDSAKTGVDAFQAANSVVIGKLKELQRIMGSDAARDLIFSIAAQLQINGASPEEAFDAIQQLGNAIRIKMNISFEEFKEQDLLENVFRGALVELDLIQESMDGLLQNTVSGGLQDDLLNVSSALGDLLIAAIDLGEIEEFFNLAAGLEDSIGSARDLNLLVEGIVHSIEDTLDRKLKIDLGNVRDFKGLREELDRVEFTASEIEKLAAAGIILNVETSGDFFDGDITGGLASDVEEFGIAVTKHIPGIITLTDAGMSTLIELREEMDGLLQVGEEVIINAFAAIDEGIRTQLPLLGLYSGALKTTKDEYIDSQTAFAKDLTDTQALRNNLAAEGKAGNEAFIAALDATPVPNKVWLTLLNREGLQEVIDSFNLTGSIADTVIGDTFDTDFAKILAAANTEMDRVLAIMTQKATDAGHDVLRSWEGNAGVITRSMIGTSLNAMNEIRRIFGVTIPGPNIDFEFDGGGFSPTPLDPSKDPVPNTTQNIFFQPSSGNLVQDAGTVAIVLGNRGG